MAKLLNLTENDRKILLAVLDEYLALEAPMNVKRLTNIRGAQRLIPRLQKLSEAGESGAYLKGLSWKDRSERGKAAAQARWEKQRTAR